MPASAAARRGSGRVVRRGTSSPTAQVRRDTPPENIRTAGVAQRRGTAMVGKSGGGGGAKSAPRERKPWRLFACFEKKSEYEKRRDARKKQWKQGDGKGAPKRLSKHISWNEERLIEPPSPASLRAMETPEPEPAPEEPHATSDAVARAIETAEAIPGVRTAEGVVDGLAHEAIDDAAHLAHLAKGDEQCACPGALLSPVEAQYSVPPSERPIGLLDIVCCGKNETPAMVQQLQVYCTWLREDSRRN